MPASQTDTEGLVTELTRIASDALAGTGLLVDHITVTPAGKRRVVGVAVDRDLADLDPADHTSRVPGVDLDTVADATRTISEAFDGPAGTAALGQRPYVLEVSTPGVSRPLTEPRHFRRNVGRLLELTLAGGDKVTGRIVAADDSGVTIALTSPGTKGRPAAPTGQEATYAYPDITRAAVEVEFVSDDADDAAFDDDADDDEQED